MKTMELFCGTKSFSKVADSLGWETLTFDIDPQFEPDVLIDLMEFDYKNIRPKTINRLWASPPCTAFSVASIGKH